MFMVRYRDIMLVLGLDLALGLGLQVSPILGFKVN